LQSRLCVGIVWRVSAKLVCKTVPYIVLGISGNMPPPPPPGLGASAPRRS
jgi:hypothetical protein